MKKALLFATLLFSAGAFGQAPSGTTPKALLDTNGFPLGSILAQPTSLPRTVASTAYSYTGVRALAEINDANDADAYPWLSSNGLRLYYISGTNSKLMFSKRATTNTPFSAPSIVPLDIPYAPGSCWLSADELAIYFTANNCLYFAQRASLAANFGTPAMVALTGLLTSFISSPSLNTTNDKLFLFASAIGVVEFSRTSATSFDYVRTLPIPAGYLPYPGQLSKDNLTYFLGASSGTDKRQLYQLTRTSTATAFQASSFQQVQGINAITAYNGQPSMSANMEWVVFTGTSLNTWASNELYLASRGEVTAISTIKDNPLSVAVYPNPAADYIKLKYKYSASQPGTLTILSITGATVLTQPLDNASGQLTLDTKSLSNGIYLYQISQLNNDKLAISTGKFSVVH